MRPKDLQEDIEWLEELLAMRHHYQNHPKVADIDAEIERVRQFMATHDYVPKEARRQASINRFGADSAYC